MPVKRVVDGAKAATDKIAQEAATAVRAVQQAEKAALKAVGPKTAPPEAPLAVAPPEGEQGIMQDFAARRLKELTDELHKALPLIEKAGFRLNAMAVDVGVPPKLAPRFLVEDAVSEEQKNAVLEEARGDRWLHMLLTSLFRARDLQQVVRVGKLSCHEVELHISAMPKIRITFN
jgi:hypothetical protein